MKANKLFHILFEEKIDKQFSTQDLQVLRYKVGLDQEEVRFGKATSSASELFLTHTFVLRN